MRWPYNSIRIVYNCGSVRAYVCVVVYKRTSPHLLAPAALLVVCVQAIIPPPPSLHVHVYTCTHRLAQVDEVPGLQDVAGCKLNAEPKGVQAHDSQSACLAMLAPSSKSHPPACCLLCRAWRQ